jgi:hypothetical protein
MAEVANEIDPTAFETATLKHGQFTADQAAT